MTLTTKCRTKGCMALGVEIPILHVPATVRGTGMPYIHPLVLVMNDGVCETHRSSYLRNYVPENKQVELDLRYGKQNLDLRWDMARIMYVHYLAADRMINPLKIWERYDGRAPQFKLMGI